MGQLRRLARSDVERAPNERGSRRQLVHRRDRRWANAEVPSTKICEPGVPGRPKRSARRGNDARRSTFACKLIEHLEADNDFRRSFRTKASHSIDFTNQIAERLDAAHVKGVVTLHIYRRLRCSICDLYRYNNTSQHRESYSNRLLKCGSFVKKNYAKHGSEHGTHGRKWYYN